MNESSSHLGTNATQGNGREGFTSIELLDATAYNKIHCAMWALTGAVGTSTLLVEVFDKNGTINNIL
jgi:hypothetical protein